MVVTIKPNRTFFLFLLILLGLFLLHRSLTPQEEKSSVEEVSAFSPSQKVSLHDLLAASIWAAERGGEEVVKVRKSAGKLKETVKGKTKEGVQDSATLGDFNSHNVMYYGLRKAFPAIKVISEEHSAAPQESVEAARKDGESFQFPDLLLDPEDVTVWIDPLDATKEYTENLVQYVTTMVGVAVKGRPFFGVVHKPFERVTFWGVAGHGISDSLRKEMKAQDMAAGNGKRRVIVSRSHAGSVEKYAKSTVEGVEILRAAGAGYKVLEVLAGRAEVYVHITAIKKWDLLAGNALLASTGGRMTTLEGQDIDYSGYSDPVNTKGILAFAKDQEWISQLKGIIKED